MKNIDNGLKELVLNYPFLKEAIELGIEEKTISTSRIRHKFHIPYPNALKIINIMEKKGLVSEHDELFLRKVLITEEEFAQLFI